MRSLYVAMSNTRVNITKSNGLYHLQLRVGDRGSDFVNAYLTSAEMDLLQGAITEALGVLNTPSRQVKITLASQ